MSELAHYTFLPWLRQGMAAKIRETDTLGTTDGTTIERASLRVEVVLEDTALENGEKHENVISKTVKIVGPGDIMGISNRVIVRTEPKPNIGNFEPNHLAYIEFYEEDFPWRYTPANPNTANATDARRLRPWLALIVLKEGEYTINQNLQGLPSVAIGDAVINDVLPSHKETWAWAHVHFNQELSATEGNALVTEVMNELEEDPDIAVSRLICPRKLNKSTAYTAFLIPAFETGRLAGLGEDPKGLKSQMPSWKKGEMPIATVRPFEFPIYHHWNFRTGEFGDFESLVSILKPVVTKADSGKMPMDIHSPGFGLDGVAVPEIIGMEGALQPPAFVPDPWSLSPEDNPFVKKLTTILNLPRDLSEKNSGVATQVQQVDNPFYSGKVVDDPILAPPTYGYWHSLISRLGESANPKWVDQLNLDPRFRAAAGLGTKAVQDKQEDLMHEAWQQVGSINQANQKIREAELAKLAAKALFAKHLKSANTDQFISFTSSIHNQIRSASTPKTVNQEFRESRVPIAAKSAAFKRIVRPTHRNKKISQVSSSALYMHSHLLTNFNKEESDPTSVIAAKLRKPPEYTLSESMATTAITSAIDSYEADNSSVAKEVFFSIIAKTSLDAIDKNQWKTALNGWAGLSAEVKALVNQLIDSIQAYQKEPSGFLTVTITKEKYVEVFGEGSTAKTHNLVRVRREDETEETKRVASATSIDDLQAFQKSFQVLTTAINSLPSPALRPLIGNMKSLRQNLQAKIEPQRTLEMKMARQIRISVNGVLVLLEKLKPVMAYPKFPEPVYELLSKISQRYILPNVDKLPADSITLLQTNQRFIEAFMVGMNHEMARELLWREFPTDQRGSYFRQFWDVRDNLAEGEVSSKQDIKPLDKWKLELGHHSPRPSAVSGNMVLVVRGQLLLKYPNTLVYAQRAEYDPADPTKPRKLPDNINGGVIKHPLFSAELEPDITLFGFDLTAPQAKGERAESATTNTSALNPGWFFVFKERPGQIKFGLDDYADKLGNTDGMPTENPATWNDLTWEHLVKNKEDLDSFHLNFSSKVAIPSPAAGEPNPLFGDNAADMASILYQNPVLFARHAQEMLPE